jgi:very-short-patch-repair endonuclease
VRVLEAHGVSSGAIVSAVRRGDLIRLRQGWLSLPGADPQVVSAVRIGGHLSCTSVLARHGIWCDDDRRVHVRAEPGAQLSAPHSRAVPLGRHHRVVVHRTGRLPLPAAPADDLATAVAVAMTCQSRPNAIATLDCILNLGIMSVRELREVLAPLAAKHRGYLAYADPRSQSGLETMARLGFRRHRIRVRSQVSISGVGHVDLLLGDRLVIELDGYKWHSTRVAFDEDRRRDLELARRGYIVLRLSYQQVMFGWPEVERVVLGHIHRREHLWAARHVRAGFRTH